MNYRMDVAENADEYILTIKELTEAEKRFLQSKGEWLRQSGSNGAGAKASRTGKENKAEVNSRTEDGEGVAKN